MPTSQASILQLREQGFTNTQIGRLVGRDSSLIKQISEGKKPGANLSEALAGFVGKPATEAKPVDVARRLSKSGGPAKVRAGVHEAIPGRADRIQINTEQGRKSQVNQIQRVPKDAKVFLTVTVKKIRYVPDFTSDGTPLGEDGTLKNKEVDLFANGGWSAGNLLQRIEAAGGDGAAFNAVILAQIQSLPQVEHAEGIGRVEMQIKR